MKELDCANVRYKFITVYFKLLWCAKRSHVDIYKLTNFYEPYSLCIPTNWFQLLICIFFQLFRILSDMRTLSADWMANNSRPEAEQQSMHHVGEESRGNIFYPRAVAPTAAQVSLYPCVLDYNKNQWFFFSFFVRIKSFSKFSLNCTSLFMHIDFFFLFILFTYHWLDKINAKSISVCA